MKRKLTPETEAELNALREILSLLEPMEADQRAYVLAEAALVLRLVPVSSAHSIVMEARKMTSLDRREAYA